jgi:outer membrane protein
MNKTFKLVLLTSALMAGYSNTSFAEEKSGSPWLVRARIIGVLPESGGNTTIGGKPDPDNAYVPELDFSYFFTKNIAAELILATSPHNVKLKGSSSGDLNLGDTMILPPTLLLQYHFTPDQKFSPYLGAGINYTLPYAEDAKDVDKLEVDGSFGVALQAGADYWLDDHWGLNLDVKKLWLDVDASVNSGAITGEVDLDPWVVGAGVSYRF